ncbi:metal ABC transporter permease [Aliivibrio fischeri]|uniref:metal ABC transporter permease n=1 Tax=Aliivibrio fischeri TaxID=668 RepID=UPI001F2ACD23|nr:metal ABC transporter permease [Aliivibrio fischeri]MCE7537483.1 metal ABC transporter permease [Aliivibrio fischeri]MCE7560381.1 metal ABC transporter permease [Aliivibrio fischeri]
MLDDFLWRATLAGVGVTLATAPLGCFIVWRRMAYFGDATAHASMLGIALSLALSLPILPSVLFIALIMAITVSKFSGRSYAMDTLLGVMAHSALAIGLMAVSFLSGIRLDLMAYLFGDILAVSKMDLFIIWGGALFIIGLIRFRWSGLLLSTLDKDLALASNFSPKREQLILTIALAIVVAVAIKVVGVLLIVAMLIIPAAAARPFSQTPEMMVVLAALIGSSSSILGLRASYLFDTPTGPTIVCIATGLFITSSLIRKLKTRHNLDLDNNEN